MTFEVFLCDNIRRFHGAFSWFFGKWPPWAQKFLGANYDAPAPAFFKDWQPRSGETIPPMLRDPEEPYPLEAGSTGTYLLALVHTPRQKAEVERMLPPDLMLDPNAPGPPGTHPLIVTFGYEEKVRTVYEQAGMNYLEFIVGVPYVKLREPGADYPGPFIYMPLLYLKNLVPILLGRMVGYPKRFARIETAGQSYSVASHRDGRPIVNASFEPQGSRAKPLEDPSFAPIVGMLEQPAVGYSFFGYRIFTHLHWRLDLALLQAVSTSMTVAAPGLPGFPAGEYHWNGLAPDGTGSCLMSVPWEFVLPYPRSILLPRGKVRAAATS